MPIDTNYAKVLIDISSNSSLKFALGFFLLDCCINFIVQYWEDVFCSNFQILCDIIRKISILINLPLHLSQ